MCALPANDLNLALLIRRDSTLVRWFSLEMALTLKTAASPEFPAKRRIYVCLFHSSNPPLCANTFRVLGLHVLMVQLALPLHLRLSAHLSVSPCVSLVSESLTPLTPWVSWNRLPYSAWGRRSSLTRDFPSFVSHGRSSLKASYSTRFHVHVALPVSSQSHDSDDTQTWTQAPALLVLSDPALKKRP